MFRQNGADQRRNGYAEQERIADVGRQVDETVAQCGADAVFFICAAAGACLDRRNGDGVCRFIVGAEAVNQESAG